MPGGQLLPATDSDALMRSLATLASSMSSPEVRPPRPSTLQPYSYHPGLRSRSNHPCRNTTSSQAHNTTSTPPTNPILEQDIPFLPTLHSRPLPAHLFNNRLPRRIPRQGITAHFDIMPHDNLLQLVFLFLCPSSSTPFGLVPQFVPPPGPAVVFGPPDRGGYLGPLAGVGKACSGMLVEVLVKVRRRGREGIDRW